MPSSVKIHHRKRRVLSGMRSTNPRLHLGNYEGALKNWVKLQDSYESFHFVADWHALTSDYADTSAIRQNTIRPPNWSLLSGA